MLQLFTVETTCYRSYKGELRAWSETVEEKWTVKWYEWQEAQLSQRNRATLRVIEYFAMSPKVTQSHSK